MILLERIYLLSMCKTLTFPDKLFLWFGKNKSMFTQILTVNKLRLEYEEKGEGGNLIFRNNALMFIHESLNYIVFSHTENQLHERKYRKKRGHSAATTVK